MSGAMMPVTVAFSTNRYEQVHHRKPRGYSLWYFRLPNGCTLSCAGTYWKAKRAAAKMVKGHCGSTTARAQVCP